MLGCQTGGVHIALAMVGQGAVFGIAISGEVEQGNLVGESFGAAAVPQFAYEGVEDGE